MSVSRTPTSTEDFPIVFLHGFLGTKEDWNEVSSFLDAPCIAVDLPGHGSAPFSEKLILPDLPKFHLVGYSMGGRLALAIANEHPEKIASLTLLSTFTGSPPSNRLAMDQLWAQKILHSFDDFLKSWYDQPLFAGYIPDLSMRKRQNPMSLAKALLYYSPAKMPVLPTNNAFFVVGERDQKYRALYPNAVVIPNAGHAVHLEQPEAVAKVIKERVYGLDPSR
ncbi:MAG TPA: alpha/beta fold hydrolase [Chlamydiales bacterium]|nr:alpha/beta fold hydrolase [Chlamydiales bacterium]